MIKTSVSGPALLHKVSLAGSIWANEVQENTEIILEKGNGSPKETQDEGGKEVSGSDPGGQAKPTGLYPGSPGKKDTHSRIKLYFYVYLSDA